MVWHPPGVQKNIHRKGGEKTASARRNYTTRETTAKNDSSTKGDERNTCESHTHTHTHTKSIAECTVLKTHTKIFRRKL